MSVQFKALEKNVCTSLPYDCISNFFMCNNLHLNKRMALKNSTIFWWQIACISEICKNQEQAYELEPTNKIDDNIQIAWEIMQCVLYIATAILEFLDSGVPSLRLVFFLIQFLPLFILLWDTYSIIQEITDVTNPNKLVSPNRKVQLWIKRNSNLYLR
jgi:hypothetical protein